MDAAEGAHARLAEVATAYGTRSELYIDRFGSADKADAADRSLIATWAAAIRGPVLDAGCGPGHWSAFLHGLGVSVEGVDATPEFVAHARRSYPEIPFRLGDLREPAAPASSLAGVLAWFSLIHLHPDEVPAALSAFAGALAPGGSVLLGFFADDSRLQPFPHGITMTAWAWPMDLMADALRATGFEVVQQRRRETSSRRINAAAIARLR